LDEAYAGTSSIMPQKKNPSSLEMIKGFTAESIGALMNVASSVKGVAYTNIGDRMALDPLIIGTTIGCSNVMSGVIATLEPIKETMMSKVTKGFSTMTELTDTLVRNHGISFRQAHDIIANVTSKVFSEGKTAGDITINMVNDASLTSIGKRLEILEKELRLATDPFENVKRRSVTGGPAPKEVERMIHDRLQKINDMEIMHKARQKKLEDAYEILNEKEKTILN
jgi:argininosuccinate lyase